MSKKYLAVFLLSIFSMLVFLVNGCSEKNTVVNVAVSPAAPPMLFDDHGVLKGVDLEIFEGYCKARGYTLKITSYDWQGMLGAVSTGQADVAFSAISITEKRKELMDFSQPYYANTWHLVSLEKRNITITHLSELKHYSIGYPRGMVYNDFIQNELEPKGYYPLTKVKIYPTYIETMEGLQNGAIDLVFMDEPVFFNYKYKMKLPFKSNYAFTGIDNLGFAFVKGSKMRSDFDKYLTELGTEKRQAILDKWIK